eukprot:scaffold73428_cov53-Attheya_sp.AAC.1
MASASSAMNGLTITRRLHFNLTDKVLSGESFCIECSPRRDYALRNDRISTALFVAAPPMDGQQVIESDEIDKKLGIHKEQGNNVSLTAFRTLAGNVARCLVRSDLKRNFGLDGASTGWTSWVDDESAFRLQCCIDYMSLSNPENPIDSEHMTGLSERDTSLAWLRWMKATPSPMVIEMSKELREAVNQTITDYDLIRIDSGREELLERIGFRIILLPSGSELRHPLQTPPGAMAYGKLIYGGVTRFRLLPGGKDKAKRRAGERTEIKAKTNDKTKCWLQYGGPDRKYESLDMGSAALVEVLILPKGVSHGVMLEDTEGDMVITNLPKVGGWDLDDMWSFQEEDTKSISTHESNQQTEERKTEEDATILSGKERNDMLQTSFSSSVGGLRPQINEIVRRVLDGRVIRPFNSGSDGDEENEREDADFTALAREISKSLNARAPKVVAAPELLDRWVGGSEKLVRGLFEDAEAELASVNGDASKSALHVLVIDEIDAVFRKRSSSEDSGEATRASAVNQILAKLDGVSAIPNVLLIGMTNRRELLDEALLRPGRLEVQVKIPLPDKKGRREILQIHFEALRRRGRLSQPLCKAIDGHSSGQSNENPRKLAWFSASHAKSLISSRFHLDLASSDITGQFSGADIAGLVRCAGSLALARAREEGGGIDSLIITLEDVQKALHELKS